jgi:hypothetical protein
MNISIDIGGGWTAVRVGDEDHGSAIRTLLLRSSFRESWTRIDTGKRLAIDTLPVGATMSRSDLGHAVVSALASEKQKPAVHIPDESELPRRDELWKLTIAKHANGYHVAQYDRHGVAQFEGEVNRRSVERMIWVLLNGELT